MKIGPHEFPDACPATCAFHGDLQRYGQSALCGRCPVLLCIPFKAEDGTLMCLVDPSEYRDDWAAEWAEFFRTGQDPHLLLCKP